MGRVDESQTNIAGLQLERAEGVELLRGTVLAGRYQIEAVLGRGGAGVVLRAFDREVREAVAIKVLRPELGNATRWIERLAREVKLARQIRHPNVCRVFDFEKADGHVFIVMELAAGGPLRRELEDELLQKRPLEDRLADARAIAAGLAAIHEAGIAHRDVTPQNVLRMADGRLVVSDFGLATEVSQTTTSIHGGTLAYMAPEVVRGERASFASDVWALGVVIHEIVFGKRPAWSKPVGGAVLTPQLGRPLASAERVALAICRACMAASAAARPRSAHAVELRLAEKRAPLWPSREKRPLFVAAALIAIAGAGAVVMRSRPAARPTPTRDDVVTVAGSPGDWSTTSRVLAALEERVRCLVPLRDGRTLRFVAGAPPRVEDIDTTTGVRSTPSLVPEAYAEGCPDLAPDRKRLLFQGYTSDGRPYAFVSPRPDGAGAIATVPIADPSMASEPRWLDGGTAFSLDVDMQHMGVFSTAANRLIILPEATSQTTYTSFRSNWKDTVFVMAMPSEGSEMELVGIKWPSLDESLRLRLPGFIANLATNDGINFLVSRGDARPAPLVLRVDARAHEARRLAAFPKQVVWFLNPLGDDLAYVSIRATFDAWARRPDGDLEQLTHDGITTDASPCGSHLIVRKWTGDEASVWLLARDGTAIEKLPAGPLPGAPDCSPDGETWYQNTFQQVPGLYRCTKKVGCRSLVQGLVKWIAVSPDGTRVAFVDWVKRALRLKWIPAAGGEVRELTDSEGMCRPAWSSDHSLWVSKRSGHDAVWTELDADTGRETGKSAPGSRICMDTIDDPMSPAKRSVVAVRHDHSEIRVQAGAMRP